MYDRKRPQGWRRSAAALAGALGVATAVALSPGALAAGGANHQGLTLAITGNQATVSGLVPGGTLYILRANVAHRQGGFEEVAGPEQVAGSTVDLPLGPPPSAATGADAAAAAPGYIAVEFAQQGTAAELLYSNWWGAPPPTFTMVSQASTVVGLLAGQGGDPQLNGPTCGSIQGSQQPSGDYVVTWSGCDQLSPGQFVVIVAAAPTASGGNPFDNPTDVLGMWYTYVPAGGGPVTYDLGSTNNLANSPITADEWVAMSVFSSNVESPAGQLPEVPWAAGIPLLMGGPLAWWAWRKRRVQA